MSSHTFVSPHLEPESLIEAVAHAVGILDVILDHHSITTQTRRALTYVHNDLTGPRRHEETTLAAARKSLGLVLDSCELATITRAGLTRARHKLPPVFSAEAPFSPTPGVLVSMSTAELPARYPLMLRSEERDGLRAVCMVFNAALTTRERVRWVRHAVTRGEVMSANLADLVAVELTRRAAQGAEEVNR